MKKFDGDFFNDAFPFALGYWQGRAFGQIENGTYENMSEEHKHLFRCGYDAGVTDYVELDSWQDQEKRRFMTSME